MGVVSVAVAVAALLLTTQLVEAVLLRLATLPWRRRRHDHHDASRHHHHRHQHEQCSDEWTATYAQFDDVTETCVPEQRNVIVFDLSSAFAETNV